MERTYGAEIDQAVLRYYLRRLCELGEEGRELFGAFDESLAGGDEGAIEEYVAGLWSGEVGFERRRSGWGFWRGRATAELEASEDPFVQLARVCGR